MTDQLPDIEDENPKNIEIRIDIEGSGAAPGRNKRDCNPVFLSGIKTKGNC